MLPAHFLERMKFFLEEEFPEFLSSYQDSPLSGLRVNTLKLETSAFLNLSPFELTPIPWTPDGFATPSDCRPGSHPYHAAGLYYLQDPSAMAVTELLDPQPGDKVLDLAAAPGGKATHIASKMKQHGLLLANDINSRRVRTLYNNLERWGARNTIVTNEIPSRLAEHFGSFFDKVLLDAPCSGEGMFRKDPSATYEWSPTMVESCARRQEEILIDAARLVSPGGRLVYATCTFAPEENEGVIFRFLRNHPEFDLEKVEERDGFYPGKPEWVSSIPAQANRVDIGDLAYSVRLWPHKSPGEGHFIAVLHKNRASSVDKTRTQPFQFSPPTGASKSYFAAFERDTLRSDGLSDRLSLHGNCLYQVPAGIPDLHGLRVVHWGWWIGRIKTGRFEPSQAFVMALTPEDMRQVLDFRLESAALKSYLKGEVLQESGQDGWVMIAVNGFPLGWGKRVRNRLKPHFPRWLRLVG